MSRVSVILTDNVRSMIPSIRNQRACVSRDRWRDYELVIVSSDPVQTSEGEHDAADCESLVRCRRVESLDEAIRSADGDRIVVITQGNLDVTSAIGDLFDALDHPAVEVAVGSLPGTSRSAGGAVVTVSCRLLRRFFGISDATLPAWCARTSTVTRVLAGHAARTIDPAIPLIATLPRNAVADVPLAVDADDDRRGTHGRLSSARLLLQMIEHRFAKSFEFVRFGLVGSSGMVVDLLSFWLLRSICPFAVARALAIVVAMTWNFALNRTFTFRRARRESIVRQYLSYCGGCAMGNGLNWGSSVSLQMLSAFFRKYEFLAVFAGVLVGTLFNFELCRRFVFRSAKHDALPPTPDPTARDDVDPKTESPVVGEIAAESHPRSSRSRAEKVRQP